MQRYRLFLGQCNLLYAGYPIVLGNFFRAPDYFWDSALCALTQIIFGTVCLACVVTRSLMLPPRAAQLASTLSSRVRQQPANIR